MTAKPTLHCIYCGCRQLAGDRTPDGDINVLACPTCGMMVFGVENCAHYVMRAMSKVLWDRK